MIHSTEKPENSVPESAIRRGIKTVGVGKKGSKSLSFPAAQELLMSLKAGEGSEAARGAFFAGLLCKGLTADEQILSELFPPGTLTDPYLLAAHLCGSAPASIKKICGDLLAQKELDKQTAYELGRFLMSDAPGDGARGVAASALRVRYETADEYEGLLQSLQETITPAFQQSVPKGLPVLQLAEPFDGVDHNYLITPCVAQFLKTLNFRVVSLMGRNSGPKFVNNLYDLVGQLNWAGLKKNLDLNNPQPPAGWYIDQKDLSPALDRWVDIRHQTIKRPFFATLEKFLNPCNAEILIVSAFHAVYGEKMVEIAERARFPGIIVVRNGIEGTIAFPLTRPAKLLISTRQADGRYQREEMIFDALEFLGLQMTVEEKLDLPSLTKNAELVNHFLSNGKSGHSEFDARVQATCGGLQKAITWIQNKKGEAHDLGQNR